MFRKPMSFRKSKKLFRKTYKKVHKKNVARSGQRL